MNKCVWLLVYLLFILNLNLNNWKYVAISLVLLGLIIVNTWRVAMWMRFLIDELMVLNLEREVDDSVNSAEGRMRGLVAFKSFTLEMILIWSWYDYHHSSYRVCEAIFFFFLFSLKFLFFTSLCLFVLSYLKVGWMKLMLVKEDPLIFT